LLQLANDKDAAMSRAFVKEHDDANVVELPDRLISEHANLVTKEGLQQIEVQVQRLTAEHTQAQADEDRARAAATARDLRYWTARLQNAEVVTPPADPTHVHFASTVTIARNDGRRQTFRIVGEDEAEPAKGTIPYVSPLARALVGKAVGDVVRLGEGEVEVLEIR
jgi:transcription elongation GreA/GreB family factor